MKSPSVQMETESMDASASQDIMAVESDNHPEPKSTVSSDQTEGLEALLVSCGEEPGASPAPIEGQDEYVMVYREASLS